MGINPYIPTEPTEIERWRNNQNLNETWVSTTHTFPTPEKFLQILEQQGLAEHAKAYRSVIKLAQEVQDEGGQLVLIGGTVRDIVLGMTPKDFDVEIYGLPPEIIRRLANQIGKAEETGKSFGVLKVRPAGVTREQLYLDIAMPRRETKRGQGHGNFDINVDPYMNFKEATDRRDFTMNAMCADPLTGKIYDPQGGIADLEQHTLRVVNQRTFAEDPLRALRTVRFIAMFNWLEIDEPSARTIQAITQEELETLPKARLREEWRKLMKARNPAKGLQLGMELGVWEKLHPMLLELKNTEQDPKWHPEGTVWEHTLLVVTQASEIVREQNLWETNPDSALAIMLASFCHDFGKPTTTAKEEHISASGETEMRITSKGHCEAGIEPAKKFLYQIGIPKAIVKRVIPLIREHLAIIMLYQQDRAHGVRNSAIIRLLKRLEPATLEELIAITLADQLGRGSFVDTDGGVRTTLEAIDWIRERVKSIELDENSRPTNIVSGYWLIDLGIEPQGRPFGELLEWVNSYLQDLSPEKREEAKMTLARFIEYAGESLDPEEVLAKLKTEYRTW